MTNWLNKFGITDQLTVTDRGVYLVTLEISDFLTFQISTLNSQGCCGIYMIGTLNVKSSIVFMVDIFSAI